jgi:hypothetical protein
LVSVGVPECRRLLRGKSAVEWFGSIPWNLDGVFCFCEVGGRIGARPAAMTWLLFFFFFGEELVLARQVIEKDNKK